MCRVETRETEGGVEGKRNTADSNENKRKKVKKGGKVKQREKKNRFWWELATRA